MNETVRKQIQDHMVFIYGTDNAKPIADKLIRQLDKFSADHPQFLQTVNPNERVTEADSILITYGDQVQEPGKSPLCTLSEVLATHLNGIVSSVHLLPFYPYSSDDGFSVMDYKAINPGWGDWDDVGLINENFRLMFDAVINHVSAKGVWFEKFLKDNPKYANYFIVIDPGTDLSSVTRPRTSPLLTPFETPSGTKHVWTTFSADQVDINYENPDVLLAIIDVLLFYVSQGAEFIRLDAIAYMWKEIGSTCIHLPQVHRIIQLFRTVLDGVAPNVMLITETNVPHPENISYFGNGENEAQMVYNFSLPPLILHTFHSGDASVIQKWADNLEDLPDTATFFNFIASHDGIGVRPAEGLLSPAEIQNLCDKTVAHGGQVSYKNNSDGSQSPYELNVTLFDALSNPNSEEPVELQISRFIASQAIMLAMAGVPGIYVHSLVGSANDHAGMKETGRARTINRQKWQRSDLEAALAEPESRANKVFQRYAELLKARASSPAFHPNGSQQIIGGNPAFFNLMRTSPDGQERVLCLHNITDHAQYLEVDVSNLLQSDSARELFTDKMVILEGGVLRTTVEPYGVKWLAA
ncbi:MAG: alpha-glucosidase C-terminal domain-containing protein [Anaerolineae bacterium]|nr:alpha-glucosidase C-terminal domain-containing protein [Anaerolineae bacterium]